MFDYLAVRVESKDVDARVVLIAGPLLMAMKDDEVARGWAPVQCPASASSATLKGRCRQIHGGGLEADAAAGGKNVSKRGNRSRSGGTDVFVRERRDRTTQGTTSRGARS